MKGPDAGLEAWVTTLQETKFQPHIVTWDGSVVLRADALDAASDAGDVREKALPLIARLNGIMACKRIGPIEFDCAVEFSTLGPRRHHVLVPVTGSLHVVLGDVTLTVGSALPKSHLPDVAQPDWVQRAFNQAATDRKLDHALRCFSGAGNDWAEIYKTIEALCAHSGMVKRAFLKHIDPRGADMNQTANFYRHANIAGSHHALPDAPVSLAEAHSILSGYLKRIVK